MGALAGYMAAGSVLAESAMAGAAALTVVAAGIATGTVTGHQINERIEERVLTMGSGASQKVWLVRPSIHLDPIWNQIMTEARRSFRGTIHGRTSRSNDADADIVLTQENEICTHDKVLLLVNRILNDKTSLSGHVYRYLIETFHQRARDREQLVSSNDSIAAVSPRARRDDAHAVIKHITACLLEERPALAQSPFLTEVAANAVEALVFGHLYEPVYEEIVWETQERDAGLWRKITQFRAQPPNGGADCIMESGRESTTSTAVATMMSPSAIMALQMLPGAHSAAEKLHFSVQFLDRVSEHFANHTARSVCADSLLKMVCQHMVWAENEGGLNSQVGFLEEFARDEQLLRGREGYALVTLQASLHFLNLPSTDLQRDIFAEDDEDDDSGTDEDEVEEEMSEVSETTRSEALAEIESHQAVLACASPGEEQDGSTAESSRNDSFKSCLSD